MKPRTRNHVARIPLRTTASFVFGIELLFVSSGLLHVTNWTAREASAAIISCQCFLVRKHVVVAGRDTWPAGSACRLVEDWSANAKRFKHFVCTSRRGPTLGGVQHFLGSSTGHGFALKRYLSAERRTYSRAPRHSFASSAPSSTESLADVLPALHREHYLVSHTLGQKIAWRASSWRFLNSKHSRCRN
ncbi:uncharacterized protein LOC142767181 [Rhipicephalus microplus]|uniref:uncharacterized protein LOC142767181 n=1 Tax=Rhipicephalus microplus TaxID=6941 RepID=UPI003F6B0698